MINKLKVFIVQVAALTLLLLTISIAAFGQGDQLKIHYHLAMPHPSSHLLEVSIDVDIPSQTKTDYLDFQMPKWSPGRYAVFDFAKNVQEVNAEVACPAGLDCSLPNLAVTRVDDQTWRTDVGNFTPAGMSLMFSYRV